MPPANYRLRIFTTLLCESAPPSYQTVEMRVCQVSLLVGRDSGTWLAASTYDMVVPLRANRHKTVGTVRRDHWALQSRRFEKPGKTAS
jgi:hypothetical protein